MKTVLLCLCGSALAFIINPSWTVDPFGWVDQWGYAGLAANFPELVRAFPSAPQGELLTVYLPQWLVHRALGLELANVVLDCVRLTLMTACISIVVARRSTRAVGAVTGLLMFANPYVLTTAGSSYTDGAVALYLAILLLLIEFSITGSTWTKRLSVIGAGLCFSAMIFSAVMSLAYLPVLLIGLSLISDEHKNGTLRKVALTSAKRIGLFFIGGLAGTTIFQIVFSTYGDGFFFQRNINKLFSYTVGGAYRAPAWGLWLPEASWLILPTLTVVSAIVVLIRVQGLSRSEKTFLLIAIGVYFSLVGLNLVVKQWSLQFLYFNQTLPLYYIALGIVISRLSIQAGELRIWRFVILATAAGNLLLLNSLDLTFGTLVAALKVIFDRPTSLQFAVAILSVAILITIISIERTAWRTSVLVVLLVLSVTSFSPTFGCFLCMEGFASRSRPEYISSSALILKNTALISNHLRVIDRDREAKIWYSENSEVGPLIRQVNAFFYLNESTRRVSKNYPVIVEPDQPIGSEGTIPTIGDHILAIGFDVFSQIPLAVHELEALGLSLDKVSRFEINLYHGTKPLQVLSIQVS